MMHENAHEPWSERARGRGRVGERERGRQGERERGREEERERVREGESERGREGESAQEQLGGKYEQGFHNQLNTEQSVRRALPRRDATGAAARHAPDCTPCFIVHRPYPSPAGEAPRLAHAVCR
jgi:hypothetical protein